MQDPPPPKNKPKPPPPPNFHVVMSPERKMNTGLLRRKFSPLRRSCTHPPRPLGPAHMIIPSITAIAAPRVRMYVSCAPARYKAASYEAPSTTERKRKRDGIECEARQGKARPVQQQVWPLPRRQFRGSQWLSRPFGLVLGIPPPPPRCSLASVLCTAGRQGYYV